MSTTKSSVTEFRTPQPELFPRIANRQSGAEAYLSQTLMDKVSPGMLKRFGEHVRLAGTDPGTEDFHELEILEEFLDCHVQANRICDVQCMLLWSEWVRNFRRQASGYPKLILEKEFRAVITDNFGVEIANDNFRGAVYSGIKFVP
jgi:hypothetical protein